MKRIVSLLCLPLLLVAGCGHAPVTANARPAALVAARGATAGVAHIQDLATQGLATAAGMGDWDARYGATNHSLLAIYEVPLESGRTANDLVARMGILAANGYGYMGFKPAAEERYKLQVVVLKYMATGPSESALYQGTPLFTMAVGMLNATSGFDPGYKVGVSVLSCIKDYYKDAAISRTAKDILKRAIAAPDKATGYQIMIDGLNQLGAAAAIKAPASR